MWSEVLSAGYGVGWKALTTSDDDPFQAKDYGFQGKLYERLHTAVIYARRPEVWVPMNHMQGQAPYTGVRNIGFGPWTNQA